ncbi:hypothetical protein LOT_0027 [Lentilactobacillus otakiensis DSM 19908 = JCM 15040]|uniref:Uncharacterized protein n=1 Tax=Lentilactobacillus otakiensis DSM 19908 = JCM 15040 TaxID=1423780 RepID=S4NA65_9LACO|nr:hypothetical protein LOT_0027 [Lentilactobacillus otakiensis DSM 19908 = JCM 15040]
MWNTFQQTNLNQSTSVTKTKNSSKQKYDKSDDLICRIYLL